MKHTFFSAVAVAGMALLTACQGAGLTSNAIPGVPAGQPANTMGAPQQPFIGQLAPPASADGEIPVTAANSVRQVCPQAGPGEKQCYALERADLRANTGDAATTHGGYGPPDLQSAYKISGPKSSMVAIVDAYGYPRASADLASYRSYYHLPVCTTENHCLTIRNQTGGTVPPPPNTNWDEEQALDLDMVSAMCPNCHILLVQAKSTYTNDLYASVAESAKLGAAVISNSYGGSEYGQCGGGGEKSDPAFSAPGHIYVASAGDYGGGLKNCGGAQQPCSLSTVVCVGGTKLVHSNNERGWNETVWNELSLNECNGPCGATGSGCSTVVTKPSWQTDSGCRMRSETDVSTDASVVTPVAVYFSGLGGWTAFGGTSASAPIVAGIFGRAANGKAGNGPRNLWARRANLYAQTIGNNLYAPQSGNCASSVHYICYAGRGYNGPTGLGTPNGLAAF